MEIKRIILECEISKGQSSQVEQLIEDLEKLPPLLKSDKLDGTKEYYRELMIRGDFSQDNVECMVHDWCGTYGRTNWYKPTKDGLTLD